MLDVVVDDQGRVVIHAPAAQRGLEWLLGGEAHQGAGGVVAEVPEALYLNRAGDVANGVIAVRVVADLEHDEILVLDVLGEPVRVDQELTIGNGRGDDAQKNGEEEKAVRKEHTGFLGGTCAQLIAVTLLLQRRWRYQRACPRQTGGAAVRRAIIYDKSNIKTRD